MSASSKPKAVVRFDCFELDLENGELRRSGENLKLQPQPAKVLVLLVSRAGEIISREELTEKVWGSDTFVDFERGLNFAVRQIRSALGDDAQHPRFLETVPKRGHRFIASVQKEEVAVSRPMAIPWPGTTARVLSAALLFLVAGSGLLWWRSRPRVPVPPIVLAVLPFDDLSPDREEYLVGGLTEEMIAQVTEISPEHLRVIARTSAMQYEGTRKSARQIGQELGADYVLESSIRREGGRLRITAQLVRSADQTHLWAQSYTRNAHELLALETEVTTGIAEQIKLRLLPHVTVTGTPGSRPVSSEAHELYLKGRFFFNQRSKAGLRQSIACFKQALEAQPDYAAAYAGLADSYNLTAFYGFDPTLDAVSQAQISAEKALQLDASMAAAHAARAYTEFMWRGDWTSARRDFNRALELDDNYVPAHQWYALYLAAVGRADEAVQQMQYAERLDPLSPAVHTGLGYMYYFARDYAHAIEHAGVALQLNPDFMAGHAVKGWAYLQQKNYTEAIPELATAVKLSGGVPVYLCSLGRAYALSGRMHEAQQVLIKAETSISEPQGNGTILAALYLALGSQERALRSLEQTTSGDIQANWLRVEPEFDGLRDNPRFAAVVERIGYEKP